LNFSENNKHMSKPIVFNGTVPQLYDDYLAPFLFDAYAKDLVAGIDISAMQEVLELAAGTGVVTSHLIALLPVHARLTATDLQNDMLEVAKKNVPVPAITWEAMDMTRIHYAADRFDVIICQFGLMLVPDKFKALTEMHRVLKTGGRLRLNVWGDIKQNQVWNIAGTVIESFLGSNPMLQDPGPFSLSNEKVLSSLLNAAGFAKVNITKSDKTGSAASAAIAARGFIEGLPVSVAIRKKDPALVPEMIHALELELVRQLGDHPVNSSLQALVIEAIK
jgi:SAM-dependent methyltransferase